MKAKGLRKLMATTLAVALVVTSLPLVDIDCAYAAETAENIVTSELGNDLDSSLDDTMQSESDNAINFSNILPSLNSSSLTYNQIKLSWNKVDGATGYKIYRATSKNGKYKTVKSISNVDTTEYVNKVNASNKKYYYKLRAYKKIDGKTQWTKYSKVVSASATLGTPKITKIYLPKDNKSIHVFSERLNPWNPIEDDPDVRVKWSKVSGATHYQLYKKRTDKSKWKLVKTVSSKHTQATDPMKGNFERKWGGVNLYDYEDTNYDWVYKVRAVRKIDGKKYYGSFSKSAEYVPEWTIEELQQELSAYGETFEFPISGWFEKESGKQITFKEVMTSDLYDDLKPNYIETELRPIPNGDTYKFESILTVEEVEKLHEEKWDVMEGNWTTHWPQRINKYFNKDAILKELKSTMKWQINRWAENDPVYWDDFYSYGDENGNSWVGNWEGVNSFGIYYEKAPKTNNFYDIYMCG